MPRKDRTFTPDDLARLACRNLGTEEQVKIVHNSIEFTPDTSRKNHLPTHGPLRPPTITETVDHGKRV